MNTDKKHANRLIHEKSPYLLQHAYNPVDWYPWGDEPFEKAKRENKLVFLSIGYSACHWCHVMAHESFDNDSIAAQMNRDFVCIKVDREEYPDVDHLYQSFVQAASGHGGWPLSVFLTPDRIPVFGGTYFPGKPRQGMISFPEVLRRVNEAFHEDPQKLSRSSEKIREFLTQLNTLDETDGVPNAARVAENLYQSLEQSFDSAEGGFGPAPKFPHVPDLEFLLAYYHYTGNQKAKEMALFTLRKMACGGMYDQLGGGFHRYSTDAEWLVPHFEKMLYDNALLIPVYADAYRLTGDQFYLRIARETADFVLRELRDPTGGFYASLDADSEGEEGKFYVWEYDELLQALGKSDGEKFCRVFGVTRPGNFERRNILHIAEPDGAEEVMASARERLMILRDQRARPGLDDKILADWNGMMISALWQVYQVSGDSTYRTAAEKTMQFVLRHFRTKDGRLNHFLQSGERKIRGYLDDYAYLVRALLDGFETTQQTEMLSQALQLTDIVQEDFGDPATNSLFFTAALASRLPARVRSSYDSSTPAGSNVMAGNYLRLGAYTGNETLLLAAEQLFTAHRKALETHPTALSTLARTLLFYEQTPLEITVSPQNPVSGPHLWMELFRIFSPNRVMVWSPADNEPEIIDSTLVKGRQVSGEDAVFICHRGTCSLPVSTVGEIRDIVTGFGLHFQ